jgi:hypothetical protein
MKAALTAVHREFGLAAPKTRESKVKVS